MIDISEIRMDGGTQARAAINEETVADYADAMDDPGTVFPPVIVYYDGLAYWLADGFHRVHAWRRIGRKEIPAEIRQGDRRRAILHSVAANAAHGLRRSNADKRRAVMTLLEDDEWSTWSDRQIARQCGVSHEFVRKLRAPSLSTVDSEPRTYTTKHGSEAQMDTSRIGRARDEYPLPVFDELQPAHNPSNTSEADNAGISVAPDAAGGPAPELAPDPYGYARLTDAALLDEANGLRAALDEEKARRKAAEAEARRLKEVNRELASDDKNAVAVRYESKLKNATNAKWKALEDRDAYHRQVHALKKRVAELEAAEVPY